MKYQNSFLATTYQVGQTVFFIEEDIPVSDVIVQTESKQTANGITDYYYLARYGSKTFRESELFEDIASLKTYFGTLADGLE